MRKRKKKKHGKRRMAITRANEEKIEQMRTQNKRRGY